MLCNFAHEFPKIVAEMLDRDRKLKRHFREETITDIMMSSLMMMGGRWLIVEFPDEPKTGADMQWDFVNEDNHTFLSLLIQAKRLFGDGEQWRRHNYREMLHPSGAGGRLQAEVLCDCARTSAATIPIYMFYNPQRSCDFASDDGVLNIKGVNWAEGFFIEKLAKSANTRQLRTYNKSLAAIQPSLQSLAGLFCPSGILPFGIMARATGGWPPGGPRPPVFVGRSGFGVPVPPRPEDIYRRIHSAREGRAVDKSSPQMSELCPLPEFATSIPDEVRARVDRYRSSSGVMEHAKGLAHPRITFLSRNAPDDDPISRQVG